MSSRGSRMILVVFAALIAWAGTRLLRIDPYLTYDPFTRAASLDETPFPDVAIVDLGLEVNRRDELAGVLDRIAKLDPEAVLIDVLLTQERPDKAADATLREALKRLSGNARVVLACEFTTDGTMARPLDTFQVAGIELGLAELGLDRSGSVRTAAAYVNDGPRAVFGLSAWLAASLLGRNGVPSVTADGAHLRLEGDRGKRRISLEAGLDGRDAEGRSFVIDPRAIRTEVDVFDLRSLRELADATPEMRKAVQLPRVLVVGQHDRRSNADVLEFRSLTTEPVAGVEVHVRAAQSLLNGTPPVRFEHVGAIIAGLFAAFIGLALWSWTRRLWIMALIAVAVALAGVALGLLLFSETGLMLPATAWAGAVITALGLDFAAQVRRERAVFRDFSRVAQDARQGDEAGDGDQAVSWERLPYPICAAYEESQNREPGEGRILHLYGTAEVTLQWLGSLWMTELVHAKRPMRKLLLRGKLTKGKYLNEIVSTYRKAFSDPSVRVPRMRGLALWMEQTDTVERLANILRPRNRKVHDPRSGGARRTIEEASAVLDLAVRRVLSGVSELGDARLVEVRRSVKSEDGYRIDVSVHMGRAVAHRFDQIDNREALVEGTMALHDRSLDSLIDLTPCVAAFRPSQDAENEAAFLTGATSTGRAIYDLPGAPEGHEPKPSVRLVDMVKKLIGGVLLIGLLSGPARAEEPKADDGKKAEPAVEAPAKKEEPPVIASVRSMRGAATLQRGKAAPRPLHLLESLHAGDIITPAKGARVTLWLPANGTSRVLSAPTTLAPGEAKPAAPNKWRQLAIGLLKEIWGSRNTGRTGGTYRGESFLPIEPAMRTITARPTFQWTPPVREPGAALHVWRIDKRNGERTETLILQAPVQADRFAWPASSPALEPGMYYWCVQGDSEPVDPDDRRMFLVVEEDVRAKLQAALEKFDAETGDDPDRHFLRAGLVWKDDFRFADLAREALREHLKAKPDDEAARAALQYVEWSMHIPGSHKPDLEPQAPKQAPAPDTESKDD